MRSAYQWGLDHNSCKPALEQRKALGPRATQADWWLACPRGDWLIWQLQRLPEYQLRAVMPALLRAIDVIVHRAVEPLCDSEIDEVRAWAQGWIGGVDRSATAAAAAAAAWAEAAWAEAEAEAAARAARAAVRAAWAAEAAAEAAARAAVRAAWAEAAAEAAGAAAEAAAEAAGAAGAVRAERQQQADDIRRQIPVWPGEEA